MIAERYRMKSEPSFEARLWRRMVLVPTLLVFVVFGCVSMHTTVEKGAPLDEGKIERLEIGKTTRSDVFSLFGTPHSNFQGATEIKEAHKIPALGGDRSRGRVFLLGGVLGQVKVMKGCPSLVFGPMKGPVELPSGYGNAWTNGLGEYVLSDEPGFDPNRGSDQDWRKIERKR